MSTVKDRHKWVVNEGFKQRVEYLHTITEESTCKVCGCERSIYRHGRQYFYQYTRSGILYNHELPECIDWEKEKTNAID